MTLFLPELGQDVNWFPKAHQALDDPNGLLAIGGDLSPSRLIAAYRKGIFPWYDDNQPLLWWSPNPRAVLDPTQVHISRSMTKCIRTSPFEISVNRAFNQVIEECSYSRKSQEGTWITQSMINAYTILHQQGFAHSVEVWDQEALVGGLYGIGIGAAFCGESMFHKQANASKMAFIALCQHFSKAGGLLIDCQIQNDHLTSLGAQEIGRETFLKRLKSHSASRVRGSCWEVQTIHPCQR